MSLLAILWNSAFTWVCLSFSPLPFASLLSSIICEVKLLSHVRLFVTPWTVAHQAPPSLGFSRQEYWSGLPFPSPGDLPNPGIEPRSPAFQAEVLTSGPPGKPICKASSNNHFVFLHLFFLGIALISASCTMSQTSVHSSSDTLSIRSNLLNLFVTSTI